MKNRWLVANAARARVLEETDKAAVFVHVADLVHPQSRQKGSELAPMLEQGMAAGGCAGPVREESDPFLGLLKKLLSEQVHKAVRRTVAADCTALNERELPGRLAMLTGTK